MKDADGSTDTRLTACESCGEPAEYNGPDPFNAEVHDDDTPVWLCWLCYRSRADDV